MEAIIYVKGSKYPVKRVICQRESGKFVLENLKFPDMECYYYSFSQFEEQKEFVVKNAIKKEKETLDYINNEILTLDNEIIKLNSELAKKYRSETSVDELNKISKLKSEIETNKSTLEELRKLPEESLSSEDITSMCNIEKNITQLTKAIKRLTLRINKKENESSAEIKENIHKLEEKINIYYSQLKLIRKLKKNDADNDFFK